MEHWLKRTWAEIDLDALSYNFKLIRDKVTPGCRVMAIVKADAYGHGAAEVAKTLRLEGADWFGVSNLEEAIQLRQAGITEPILILSYTPAEEAARLNAFNLTQTVVTAEYGKRLNEQAQKANIQVRVHFKVDTGMSRVGFFYHDTHRDLSVVEEIAEVATLPNLDVQGIFTHFAVSDEQDGNEFTRDQFNRFRDLISKLKDRGITFRLKHCCNSAATLRFPEMHMDMVRPGLILYGMMPSSFMNDLLPLKSVMALKTKVSMVKEVPSGETVSYGRIYTTSEKETLATVPIGYADGYSRRLSNRAHMLVHGQKAPVVGRVCMDQCMLDITGIANVKADTTVTVFGVDEGCKLPVEEFAAWSDTINYEAVCEIGKRVPRLFLRNGNIVGQLNYIV